MHVVVALGVSDLLVEYSIIRTTENVIKSRLFKSSLAYCRWMKERL